MKARRLINAVLVLLCAAPLAHAELSRTTARDVRAVIDNAVRTSERPRRDAAAELIALDVKAVPALLEVFTGRDMMAAEPEGISEEPLFEIPPPPSWIQEVLLEVLSKLPSEAVIAELEDFDATIDERVLFFQVVGVIGNRDAVDAWITLVEDIPAMHMSRPYVAGPVESSLATLLRDVPASMNRLMKRVGDIDEPLYPAVVRSVGRSRVSEGMPFLRSLFGKDNALDIQLLREAGKLDLFENELTADAETRWIRSALEHADAGYRAEAAVAIGRLHSFTGAKGLIELLGDPERRVQRSALWSLQALSGNDWNADGARWKTWRESERKWFDDSLQRQLRDLRTGDPAKAMAAVSELGHHPAFAQRIVQELRTFTSPHDGVNLRTQAVLAQLEEALAG